MIPSSSDWNDFLGKWWPILLLGELLLNLSGIVIPIIEPDGALYATLSKTMVQSGNYTDLVLHGKDWLDKPHFPFWIAALSFQVFGISTIGYKLPAIFFWMLSVFYTYQFALLFYPQTVARLSVLIYGVAMHGVISNTDIRAEPYLVGLITGGVYHLYKISNRMAWGDLIIGCLMIACAVMTKGIFVLITIGSGLLIDLMVKKQWHKIVNAKWILVFVLTLIFILPEILCLYKQFDLHPEKEVFGRIGVSGIRFFLWDSQFGRFFNTGPIKGEGDPFFFLHTTLWAFFPWSLLFFVAVFKLLRRQTERQKEFICLGTVVITFLLFSLSQFQLPHYLNIIFPFMSILSARYLYKIELPASKRIWDIIFLVEIGLTLFVVSFLTYYFRPSSAILPSLWILPWLVIIFVPRNIPVIQAAFLRTIFACFMMFGFLNLFFIRNMVDYQSGSQAAQFLSENYPGIEVSMLNEDISFSFDFYMPGEVKHYSIQEIKLVRYPSLLFCDEKFIPLLQKAGLNAEIVKVFTHFHISEPRPLFINAKTRTKSLSYYVVVKISKI